MRCLYFFLSFASVHRFPPYFLCFFMCGRWWRGRGRGSCCCSIGRRGRMGGVWICFWWWMGHRNRRLQQCCLSSGMWRGSGREGPAWVRSPWASTSLSCRRPCLHSLTNQFAPFRDIYMMFLISHGLSLRLASNFHMGFDVLWF